MSVATDAGNAFASLWNEVAGELDGVAALHLQPDVAVIGQALRECQ